MKDTKIVLVSPPLLWEDKLRLSFQPPLNLLYLHAYLKAHKMDVTLFDPVPSGLSPEEIVSRIVTMSPAYVGIPLYYASLVQANELVAGLRERLPKVRIIAGGPSLTMEPERMMRQGAFDFGIVGEGEETLLALLSVEGAPEQEMNEFASIPGLVFRKGETVVVNRPRQPMAGLDDLPFLDFSVLDNSYYFHSQEMSHVPRTLFLNSSRGCSFRCTYCCTPRLWPGRIRRYSPRRLVNEVIYQLERFPGADIGFCDDSFFSDPAWLEEFINLVKPLRIHFQCIGRADHLTSPMIGRLVESGMSYIAFGVETGSPRRQSKLKKNLDLTALVTKIQELTRLGVKTKCFFMLGFPDETLGEMVETINLASTLKKHGMTYFSIFPVTLYPGTELAEQFPNGPSTQAQNEAGSGPSCLGSHLPEIIRDNLGIKGQSPAVLDSPFNASLTQRQMVDLVTYAWGKVERAELITISDLRRVTGG